MRARVRNLWVGGAVALAVVACAAENSDIEVTTEQDAGATEPAPPLAEPDDPAQHDSSTAPDEDGAAGDAASTDASPSTDAAPDAAPVPAAPLPGDPCTKRDEIFSRPCGACGTQLALCEANDGGPLVVSAYSVCDGELPGGCIPGSRRSVECGDCGYQLESCSNRCEWKKSGTCTGEPVGHCTPGIREFAASGCSEPKTYRQRVCRDNCLWGRFTTECEEKGASFSITVPAAVGATATTTITLTKESGDKRLNAYSTCPRALFSGLAKSAPQTYVRIDNPAAQDATVTVYTKASAGGRDFDTILAAYDGKRLPDTDAERLACAFGVDDSSYGYTSLTGSSKNAILTGTRAVKIPAGGSVLAWVSVPYDYDPKHPDETTGDLDLAVRLDARP